MPASPFEVLLVEDNGADADLTIRALRKSSVKLHITHVEDGAKALDLIFAIGSYAHRNSNEVPHLILLDLKMPRIGGMEVLIKLKSDARTKKIPIIVLASSEQDPNIQRCSQLGAAGYIVKPVSNESFMNAVSILGLDSLLLGVGNSHLTK